MQLIKGNIQLERHFISEGQYVISLTGSMTAGRHGAKAVAKSYILIRKQWAEKLRLILQSLSPVTYLLNQAIPPNSS